MPYEVFLSAEAIKVLSKLEKQEEQRIRKKLKELALDPDHYGKRLARHNLYSLRVGSYRVIFTIDRSAERIFIVTVGHRRSIYARRL